MAQPLTLWLLHGHQDQAEVKVERTTHDQGLPGVEVSSEAGQ